MSSYSESEEEMETIQDNTIRACDAFKFVSETDPDDDLTTKMSDKMYSYNVFQYNFNEGYYTLTKACSKFLNPHTNFFLQDQPIFYKKVTLEVDLNYIDKTLEHKLVQVSFQTVYHMHKLIEPVTSDKMDHLCLIISTTSKEDFDKIANLFKTYKSPNKGKHGSIYSWSKYNGWQQMDELMLERNIDDMVGLDDIHDTILKTVTNYKTHIDKMVKFGLTTGLNFLFYGPPGTGKSSIARILSLENNWPLFNVKLTKESVDYMTDIMTPKNQHYEETTKIEDRIQIVLVEDFDRYLEEIGTNRTMSSLMNSLDGVLPSIGIIRIFSANNLSQLTKNNALMTRFTNVFFFDTPSDENYLKHIQKVYADYEPDIESTEKIMIKIKESKQKLNMRQLTYFLCRYLSEENPFKKASEEIQNFIDNFNYVKMYKDNDSSHDGSTDDSSYDSTDDSLDVDSDNIPKLLKPTINSPEGNSDFSDDEYDDSFNIKYVQGVNCASNRPECSSECDDFDQTIDFKQLYVCTMNLGKVSKYAICIIGLYYLVLIIVALLRSFSEILL
jgi:AAA+ superfamily predicted ATPase